MPYFDVRESNKTQLTALAGLSLVGQCPDLAQVEEIFGCAQKVERGTRTSDLVRGAAGLLCTGKSDFEAAEGLRSYPSVKIALYAKVLPGKEWMRQRLNALVPFIRDPADALTMRLLERSGAPITPRKGFGCVDIATFVMDSSGSRKEAVSRTYQGVEGYSPIAAYLGCEGYCIGMELRPGSKHSALEAECFLERVLPRIDALYAPKSKVLVRPDSAFDIARLGPQTAHAASNRAGARAHDRQVGPGSYGSRDRP